MSALLFLVAMQPAPPPAMRTVPVPGTQWSCELADPEWRRFTVGGRFEEFPVGSRPGYGDRGSNALVQTDSSGRFIGTHKVYLVSAAAGPANGMYNLIVEAPGRTYFHFSFEFYGEAELGTVTIEKQELAAQPNRLKGMGAGFCRAKPLKNQGNSQ